jgi:hypothetical protein
MNPPQQRIILDEAKWNWIQSPNLQHSFEAKFKAPLTELLKKTVYTTSVINNLYIGVVSIDVSTNGVVAVANCTHRSTPLNIYLSSGIATPESIIFQVQRLFVRCWLQPMLWCRFSQTICLYENLQRKPHSRSSTSENRLWRRRLITSDFLLFVSAFQSSLTICVLTYNLLFIKSI